MRQSECVVRRPETGHAEAGDHRKAGVGKQELINALRGHTILEKERGLRDSSHGHHPAAGAGQPGQVTAAQAGQGGSGGR
jgi:hypothetical protein